MHFAGSLLSHLAAGGKSYGSQDQQSRSCQSSTCVTRRFHWRAMLGAPQERQVRAGPSLGRQCRRGCLHTFPAGRCHRPATGWLLTENRHVCTGRQSPQHLFTSGRSLRSSVLQPGISTPPRHNLSTASMAQLHVTCQPFRRHSQSYSFSSLIHISLPGFYLQVFASRNLHNPGLPLREVACFLDGGCHSLMVRKSACGEV